MNVVLCTLLGLLAILAAAAGVGLPLALIPYYVGRLVAYVFKFDTRSSGRVDTWMVGFSATAILAGLLFCITLIGRASWEVGQVICKYFGW